MLFSFMNKSKDIMIIFGALQKKKRSQKMK